jgi:hypothetical protein
MSNAARELTTIEGGAMQSAHPVTPMEMLNTALTRGADVTVLEKLMGLQERWEANQARKAFDAAIAAAKGEIGPIVRNATGHNEKRYADFAAIARTVDPVLTKYGLTYRFRTEQTDRINVTCILSHKDGHSETTTLAGPPDGSGSKNAIQAIGSTLTYLQRYSLVQMLGLASSNDDDGRAATPPMDAADIKAEGERIAKDDGLVALGEWWTKTLTAADRKTLGPAALMDLKKMAGA